MCASACSLFMEMMHHEAGVRVVVAGGRPSSGPMQAPSGTRGALILDSVDDIDPMIDMAQGILEAKGSSDADFLPNRTEALTFSVAVATINIRDQARRNETTPLQFAYEAADCRIFFTKDTVFNYSALWQYAANAMWSNSSLCVANSTGFATSTTNTTDFVGPAPSVTPGTFSIKDVTAYLLDYNGTRIPYLDTGLEDGPVFSTADTTPVPKVCETSDDCGSKPPQLCVFTTSCGETQASKQCLPVCKTKFSNCGGFTGAKCTAEPNICVLGDTENKCSADFTVPGQGVCPPLTCGVLLQGKAFAGGTPQGKKSKKSPTSQF